MDGIVRSRRSGEKRKKERKTGDITNSKAFDVKGAFFLKMFLKRGWKLILIPQDSALLAKYSRIVCENFIARKRDFRREKLLELSRVFRLMDISRLESCSIDWKITMKSGKCIYIYIAVFFPLLILSSGKKKKKRKGETKKKRQ